MVTIINMWLRLLNGPGLVKYRHTKTRYFDLFGKSHKLFPLNFWDSGRVIFVFYLHRWIYCCQWANSVFEFGNHVFTIICGLKLQFYPFKLFLQNNNMLKKWIVSEVILFRNRSVVNTGNLTNGCTNIKLTAHCASFPLTDWAVVSVDHPCSLGSLPVSSHQVMCFCGAAEVLVSVV